MLVKSRQIISRRWAFLLAMVVVCLAAAIPAHALTDEQKLLELTTLKEQTLDNDQVLTSLSWGELREALRQGTLWGLPEQERYGYLVHWSVQTDALSQATLPELSLMMNQLAYDPVPGLSAPTDEVTEAKLRLISETEIKLSSTRSLQDVDKALDAVRRVADIEQKSHLLDVVADNLDSWSGVRWHRQQASKAIADIHADLTDSVSTEAQQARQHLLQALSTDPEWASLVAHHTVLKHNRVMNDSLLNTMSVAFDFADSEGLQINLDAFADAADVLVRLQATSLSSSSYTSTLAQTLIQTLDNQLVSEAPLATLGLIAQGTSPYITPESCAGLLQNCQERFITLASEVEEERAQTIKFEDMQTSSNIRELQTICTALTDEEGVESAYLEAILPWLELKESEEPYWAFFYGEYELVAKLITSDEARFQLEQHITDESGDVQQPIANALAYSYKLAGELDTWRRYIDQQIATSSDDNLKAQWLLAKGFAKAINRNGQPAPMVGTTDIERALNIATTDQIRIECLERLVYACLAYHRFDVARSLLDEYSSQISSDEAKVRLHDLIEDVEGIVVPPSSTDD